MNVLWQEDDTYRGTALGPESDVPEFVLVAVLDAGSAYPEVWKPAEGEFVPVVGRLEGQHEFATDTLLPTNEVLVLGGYDAPVRTRSWINILPFVILLLHLQIAENFLYFF